MDKTNKRAEAFFYRLIKMNRKRERQELARFLWLIRKIRREPMPEF